LKYGTIHEGISSNAQWAGSFVAGKGLATRCYEPFRLTSCELRNDHFSNPRTSGTSSQLQVLLRDIQYQKLYDLKT